MRSNRPQPTSMPAAAAALTADLVKEILLRFPLHEPACLVRVPLVCKRWCGLISGPGFRRRFRELHRTPPMLGFLYRGVADTDGANIARFVPTAAFCSPHTESRRWHAIDARHGRVLFRCPSERFDNNGVLVVWDPITDEKQKLPFPPRYTPIWTAAVLCSAAGDCDHLECHRGPFLVVYLGSDSGETFISTYSSVAADWSEPISNQQTLYWLNSFMRSVLVGNTLYFGFCMSNTALKYDLDLREMSWIQLPPACSYSGHVVLTTTEDGGLGLATTLDSKLHMWSMKARPQVDAGWTQSRIIDLETLLPSDAILTSPNVVGFAEGTGVIFVRANKVLFTIDLRTCKVKKVCMGRRIHTVVPYMSFYTSALGAACTVEGPSAGGSSA